MKSRYPYFVGVSLMLGAIGCDAASSPPAAKRRVPPTPAANIPPTPGDPVKGQFSMKQATEGLPEEGELVATLKTSEGDIRCQLFEDRAPRTVANFVGLARGIRPWWDRKANEWVRRERAHANRW